MAKQPCGYELPAGHPMSLGGRVAPLPIDFVARWHSSKVVIARSFAAHAVAAGFNTYISEGDVTSRVSHVRTDTATESDCISESPNSPTLSSAYKVS
jgi:hypothetical protein